MKQATGVPRTNFIFGTKAQTIESLAHLIKSAEIGDLYKGTRGI